MISYQLSYLLKVHWLPVMDLNHRPNGYQLFALPTELTGIDRKTPDGFIGSLIQSTVCIADTTRILLVCYVSSNTLLPGYNPSLNKVSGTRDRSYTGVSQLYPVTSLQARFKGETPSPLRICIER